MTNTFPWQWTPYLIPLASGGILTLVLALITWRRKEVRASRATALLLVSISIWSLGFAMEIASGDPQAMKFWDIFQFLGNVFLPVFWLVFALLYSDRWEKPDYPTVGLLLIFPVLLLSLVITNDWHGLIWDKVAYEMHGPIMIRVKNISAVLWAYYAYAYFLIFFGNFLLVRTYFRSRKLFRWQGTALIVGAVIPWVISALHITGLISSYLDHTPLTLTFTGLAVFININRLWRGDVIPFAHRTILESIEDAVCVLDGHNKIVDLNPAAEELIGQPLAKSAGMPITKIWPEWENLFQAHNILERSGHELCLQTAAGARYYDVRFSPLLNWQGKLISKVMVLRDITMRRQAQAELEKYATALEQHTQELKRSNEELQYFAYVASHDLREPLRMITSYLQLLDRRYQGQLDADADEFIHFAVDGAKRMESLINGLLQYSRIETRRAELAAVSSEDIVNQVLINLKLVIEESGASVISEQLPAVLADPDQLNLLFQNLLANALKYRRDVPPEVYVSAQEDTDEWVFCVADNGIGFDPEQASRIFMIFQRLHTQQEYSGLGIGLAISKKIVQRHGGRIWAESRPGEGSRFYFTIPKAANSTDPGLRVKTEKVMAPAQI